EAAFSPNGKVVAILEGETLKEGKTGAIICLLECATGKCTRRLKGKFGSGLTFSPDSKVLGVKIDSEGGVCLWDVASGASRVAFNELQIGDKSGQRHRVDSFAFSADSRTLATLGLCDPDIMQVWGFKNPGKGLPFEKCWRRMVCLWDAGSGRELR